MENVCGKIKRNVSFVRFVSFCLTDILVDALGFMFMCGDLECDCRRIGKLRVWFLPLLIVAFVWGERLLLGRNVKDASSLLLHSSVDCSAKPYTPTMEMFTGMWNIIKKHTDHFTCECTSYLLVPFHVCHSDARGYGICVNSSVKKGGVLYQERCDGSVAEECPVDPDGGIILKVHGPASFRALLRALPAESQCAMVHWSYGDASFLDGQIYVALGPTSLVNHDRQRTIIYNTQRGVCKLRAARNGPMHHDRTETRNCTMSVGTAARNLIKGDEILEDYCMDYPPDPNWFRALKREMVVDTHISDTAKRFDCI